MLKTGRYDILGEIGRGGMAIVYRGFDPVIDRFVAIKVITHPQLREAAWRGRFLNEARVAGGLTHDNIVTVHDAGESDGQPFVVMELLDGTDLTEHLRARALSLCGRLDLAIQTARGLAHAHGRGIVHCDVKPSNVLVTNANRAKLVDFGIARVVDEIRGATGILVGTPSYMAPEQIRGEAPGYPSDVFSFGCLLQEILTDERPFDGNSLHDVMHQIVEGRPRAMPGHVPEGLQEIVARCLSKTPAARYQSMEAVKKELEEAWNAVESSAQAPTMLNGSADPTVRAGTDTAFGPARLWFRSWRRRQVVPVAGALACLLLLPFALHRFRSSAAVDTREPSSLPEPPSFEPATSIRLDGPAPAPSPGLAPRPIHGVCVRLTSRTPGAERARSHLAASLAKAGVHVVSGSTACSVAVDLTATVETLEETMFDTTVTRTRAIVELLALDEHSQALLFSASKVSFSNVQDAELGQADAIKKATTALFHDHPEIISILSRRGD